MPYFGREYIGHRIYSQFIKEAISLLDMVKIEIMLKNKGYSLEEIHSMSFMKLKLTIDELVRMSERENEEYQKQQQASQAESAKMTNMHSNMSKYSTKVPSYKMPNIKGFR